MAVFLAGAAQAVAGDGPALIPAPARMTVLPGHFILQADTVIVAETAAQATGQYLAAQLRKSTGYPLTVEAQTDVITAGHDIILASETGTNLGPEDYELAITTNEVVIRAADAAGWFYGVQTLLQLLPPEALAHHPQPGVTWTAPCVEIADQPRFAWRGCMLDVSRHFFTIDQVKTLLDAMALRKLNVFHWHLVDDHGWRIEIKKYPRLTAVGAWRKDIGFHLDPKAATTYGPDGRYGGFYTQAEIRDVVAYAAARHIMVLPEIEMPGHSLAALTAYPQFGCDGVNFAIPENGGIFNGIYCAGNEKTYQFLQDVLTEVFQLFPCPYIHIGGDEVLTNNWAGCPKDQAVMRRQGLQDPLQLENYFIRRMGKFIRANGHTLIGWSEIANGGLPDNSVVMDWIGGAPEAARTGHDVVMASQKYMYLCYYPSLDRPPNLRAYRPYLPLNQVYAYEPIPTNLEARYQAHILGGEACVWTPDIPGMPDAEEMTFPRLSAVAEVYWSPRGARNWADFSSRLPAEYRRLDVCGIRYWRDTAMEIGRWRAAQIAGPDTELEWEATPAITGAGKYRCSLDYLNGKRGLKINWVALLADGREIARDTHPGDTGTREEVATDWNYFFDLPAGKPGTHYTLRASVTGERSDHSSGVVYLGPDTERP